MADLNLNNLKMDFKYIENSETAWNPNGVCGCDEESFIRSNPQAGKSIFKELDFNKDGYISEQEFACAKNMAGDDGILTDKERNDSCMEEMKFFARRGIDKWFKIDKDRDGFVLGEGAGIIVLEELEHAKKRNANILAEVVGYGATADAFHITSPAEDGSGAARAMENAMKEAGVAPEQVDYINAHGTGTHHNDLFETRAIKLAFKDAAKDVKINSTKSMVGHLLGAAGAVEFIVCVKSILDGFIHQTVGTTETEEELDLNYMIGAPAEQEVRYAMSNSLGFGGHNGTLLVKKYEEE